ncbi:MAG: hypothetical protein ACYDDF_10160 [Thermoplasmatota archaeon]
MQKLDVVVAIAGAAILAVAIGGAVLFGGAPSVQTYQITFTTKTIGFPQQSGTASGGGFTANFAILLPNITSVNFSATFHGSAARALPAPVIEQVTGPRNRTGQKSDQFPQGAGTDVTTFVMVNVSALPADHTHSASSLADAETHALTYTNRSTEGNWTVVLRATPQLPPTETITVDVVAVATVYNATVSLPAQIAAHG